jgi:hypothetical protein
LLLLSAGVLLAGVAVAATAVSTGGARASGGTAAVSSGADWFSCALSSGGAARCWGGNAYGQLGDGTTAERHTPVDVVGLPAGVASVDSGGDHACAVTGAGAALCWGRNDSGQLGDGSLADSSVPVAVSGLGSGVSAISAGYHYSCALTLAGGVKCWGSNSLGHLGDGTIIDRPTPVDVLGLSSGVAAVSAGSNSTCALTAEGGVKCWGFGSPTPSNVAGLSSGVVAISAGFNHACVLTAAGGVKCWGDNGSGELGDGTTVDSHTPVAVAKPAPPPTPTPTSTPLPPKDPDADSDADTIANSVDADDDNDGCPDASEIQTAAGSELSGGRRNPHDANDYFNPSADGKNRVDDVLLVVEGYFHDDGDDTPGLPPYEPGYDPSRDRTFVGPLAWNLGPPDGVQRVDDILNIVHQYFHDCG